MRVEADLTWSGQYRLEGQQLFNNSLDEVKREKTYAVQHLVLMPKIVAADGYIIRSRFDIFNNDTFTESQIGQQFGAGRADTTLPDTTAENQAADDIKISELYLTLTNEYGAFVAGRQPVQFGLGMSYSAGTGEFDHWIDNRDAVGYKIVMGNLYIFPSYGKISEGSLASAQDDISSWLIQVGYENTDSGLEMGLSYEARDASRLGNDSTTLANSIGGAGATIAGKLATNQLELYVKQAGESWKFAIEGSFLGGKTGVEDASGDEVTQNGFGLASEFNWRSKGSKWSMGAKMGHASGDDPETTDQWEGFIFDRNYDVGFLLFNYPLGRADFFRTALVGSQQGLNAGGLQTSPDIEALSNVTYLAPNFQFDFSDRWQMRGTFVTATLGSEPLGTDTEKAVGFEFDFAFIFTPSERVKWVNEFGYFSPGSAFEGGTNNFDTSSTYGFRSKAAINF